MLQGELSAHLRKFAAAPFLFVGAGMSRRYLGLDDWEGLLRRFAAHTGRDYGYFASTAGADRYAEIATLIAKEFHEVWWSDAAFEESRREFGAALRSSESALKVEISRYIRETSTLVEQAALADELDLMRAAQIEGAITTNYDSLLEQLFPTFAPLVGEHQMLFAEQAGVGEIYKIHGSHEDPDSLVLTANDYRHFDSRHPYLAAKLLTMFVEHPIVFLGYRLGDKNVQEILRSIAVVMDAEQIARLRDRLIFVEWSPEPVDEPHLAQTTVSVGEQDVPVPATYTRVHEFHDVFRALGQLNRKFKPKVLRSLKRHIYELVRDNDPNGRLYVLDFESDTAPAELDAVFGIGLVAQLGELGYVGYGREHLIDDVLHDSGTYKPELLVEKTLPQILRKKGNVPIFKCLRAAGHLDAFGKLIDPAKVDSRVATAATEGAKRFGPTGTWNKNKGSDFVKSISSFSELAAQATPEQVLQWVTLLPLDQQDPAILRDFLVEHRESEFEGGHSLQRSQWVKGVCWYDWLVHGLQATSA